MPTTYIARQADMLDLICARHYGLRRVRAPGLVESVLDANPGLSSLPPVLPLGTAIVLPDVPSDRTPPATIKLWD